MNWKIIAVLTVFLSFSAAQAAIVISNDDGSRQYFEDGAFVLVEDGQPAFGVDADGNCWFINEGQRVFGKCDTMFDSMDKVRQEMMAGMSEQERAMMQQMMRSNAPKQGPEIVKSGSKQIAGYSAQCHKIGSARELCTSDKLLKEIKREMGNSYFMDLQAKFGQSETRMGMNNPEQDAIFKLYKQGFPMEDMQQVTAMPGMSSAMMQFLPEAQRAEIMKQMGATGEGKMQGSRVIKVDKKGNMPKVDLSRYKTVSFEDYMQQMMGAMGGFHRKR
jgi:hypothetical protein